MIDRFEKLTANVSRIYKKIQKIKKEEMHLFGLKGTHAMCMHYLYSVSDGLTATDLCIKCNEDKAAISRILSELESIGFISYLSSAEGKKYRAKAVLTEKGKPYAEGIRKTILQITELSGKGISDEDRETFYRVLSIIANNIDNIERNDSYEPF